MKTVNVFIGVDMRMGHEGLKQYAKTRKVDLTQLEDDSACVFISSNRLRIKTYSYNHVVGYLKADSNRPFDLSAIDEFPKAFNKHGIMNYDKAIRARLEKEFARKGKLTEKKL